MTQLSDEIAPIYLGYEAKTRKYYFYFIKDSMPRFLEYYNYFFWGIGPQTALTLVPIPEQVEQDLFDFLEEKLYYEFRKKRSNSKSETPAKCYRNPQDVVGLAPPQDKGKRSPSRPSGKATPGVSIDDRAQERSGCPEELVSSGHSVSPPDAVKSGTGRTEPPKRRRRRGAVVVPDGGDGGHTPGHNEVRADELHGGHQGVQSGGVDGPDVLTKPKRHRRTKAEMMAARAAEALAAKPQIIEEKQNDSKSITKSAAKRAAEVRNGGLELGRV